jgi:lipopolysaccharide export system protein LptC
MSTTAKASGRLGIGLRLLNRGLELLPLAFMAVLAVLTYWLLQISITPPTRQAALVEHKPDYTLMDFSIRSFDAKGVVRTQVNGQRLDYFPDTETVEILQPVVRSIERDDTANTTRAERAVSNRDASEVQFFGKVQSTRDGAAGEPPLVFAGEFLHVWAEAEKLRSHLPVTITRGESVIRSNRLDYSNYDRLMQLNGKVDITLVPRKQP